MPVDRIALVKAGLTDPTRPLGVFLFVGPTGTGKTEIAKAFSEFVFGSADRLVRLDMSEYQTPESLDRLLGDAAVEQQAAPLIAQVRKQPFSVLLLDEFEKAHPQIWDIFLQVFDDGRLTDRSGRTVDLRHCVIILTSNLGSAIPTGPGIGFVGRPGRSMPPASQVVEQSFRPEFLNRLDRVVVFHPSAERDARPAREGADRRAAAARLPHAALGGRVGRGGDRLSDREGVQRRARRTAAEARRGAASPDSPRGGDRRAHLPRGRPVPVHHGAPRRRPRGRLRRPGRGRGGAARRRHPTAR